MLNSLTLFKLIFVNFLKRSKPFNGNDFSCRVRFTGIVTLKRVQNNLSFFTGVWQFLLKIAFITPFNKGIDEIVVNRKKLNTGNKSH